MLSVCIQEGHGYEKGRRHLFQSTMIAIQNDEGFSRGITKCSRQHPDIWVEDRFEYLIDMYTSRILIKSKISIETTSMYGIYQIMYSFSNQPQVKADLIDQNSKPQRTPWNANAIYPDAVLAPKEFLSDDCQPEPTTPNCKGT